MNPLERSLIEKAGYANGWENERESTAERRRQIDHSKNQGP